MPYSFDQSLRNWLDTDIKRRENAELLAKVPKRLFGKPIIDVSNIFLPHPNPALIKGREPDFLIFPQYIGGIKGDNNSMLYISRLLSA
ncbi:hypothetical protein GNF10_05915 [Nostoc sp. UCD121]|uniref:hypothetical protein n=1 Tax=unclassified Nostoc TaxID=2593658 RepID=UPI0016255A1F|nr:MULTISPECIES: hypothetical protein [unclassified Nostoc]MBC1219520.1 hypothetical protein [Nostoc sp. UCD120]MBC1275532.1 hypothetical protein [Nostoc sp. UCD121]